MIGESVLRCPNGSRGHLISSQPAVDRHSPQIQTIDCSSFEKQSKTLLLGPSPPIQRIRAPSLLARQSTICSASCSTSCYTSNIQYNPQDCYDLSGWMWARAGQYPVKPLEKIVMTWRSCVYAFTNEQQESVTWCDSPWAKIGVDLVGPCQGANGGGGVCTGQGFRAEVLSSDNPTNSSTPYMSATSLATRTSSTRSQVPTEVPLPLIPSIFPSASGYGGEPNINVIPVLVGIIAAITLFLLAIMCYCVVWRRSRERGHILPSDDGHRTREETLTNSYPMFVKGGTKSTTRGITSHTASQTTIRGTTSTRSRSRSRSRSQPRAISKIFTRSQEEPVPSLPEPARTGPVKETDGGSRPQTSSRGPTRLSTYTLDLDPFRALRRVISKRSAKSRSATPAPVV